MNPKNLTHHLRQLRYQADSIQDGIQAAGEHRDCSQLEREHEQVMAEIAECDGQVRETQEEIAKFQEQLLLVD